jgi:protease-4
MGPRLGSLDEVIVEDGNSAVKILLVDIDGPISNRPKKTLAGFKSETGMVDRVREILKKAEKDKKIKSILLRINSPGGTVTSSDIIYNEIKTFKKRNKIKVYVSVVDVAASGGYYIAMASDFIMVHPTSITGSIGVLALKLNLKGLMDKVGVEWEVVKSAEKKDFMSPFRALSDEERKLFQITINGYYERFVSIVAINRRQLDVNAVKVLADGRVFDAHEALQSKLVDSIGYLSDLVKYIENDLNFRDMQVVSYGRPDGYKSNFYSSIDSIPQVNLINLDMGFDWHQISPQFLFLWGQ